MDEELLTDALFNEIVENDEITEILEHADVFETFQMLLYAIQEFQGIFLEQIKEVIDKELQMNLVLLSNRLLNWSQPFEKYAHRILGEINDHVWEITGNLEKEEREKQLNKLRVLCYPVVVKLGEEAE